MQTQKQNNQRERQTTKKCVCGANMILTSDNHLICEIYFDNIKQMLEMVKEKMEMAA